MRIRSIVFTLGCLFISTVCSHAKLPPTRTVKFSQSQSVGRLYQVNNLDNWVLRSPFSKTFIGEARGAIKVPVDAVLYLELVANVTEQPDLLDDASSDAFDLLRIHNFLESPDGIFPHLNKIKALKRIDVVNSEVSDKALSTLKSCSSIEHLNLTGSAVTGSCVATWKDLKKLRFLDLSNNPLIKSAFRDLGQIRSLEYLDISRTRLQDSDLAKLTALGNLSVLRLRKNSDLTIKGLKYLVNFKKLHYLDLDGTKFKPHELLVLKGLPIMQMDLPQTALSAQERHELLQAFPKCALSLSSRPALRAEDERIFEPISR